MSGGYSSWLVHTATGDWKLMVALAVCKDALVSLGVYVKNTPWNIEKMRTTPLSSMVVTGVPLELSDVNVKEGLVVGSFQDPNPNPSKGGCEGLRALGSMLFVHAPT